MIQITRSLARQLRTVIRKSILTGTNRGTPLSIACRTDQHGLRIRAQAHEVSLEYHQPGTLSLETIWLPVEALDDFTGIKDTPVVLERTGPSAVQACWDDAGVPQAKDYGVKDDDPLPEFPTPTEWLAQEPRFLTALAEATKTTAKDGVRYALTRVQLRGKKGEVVATDGRQLFVENGFTFPWEGDVLVPVVSAVGGNVLPPNAPVTIAHTPTHTGIRVGPWTVFLKVDKEGRYPRIEDVIPPPASRKTTCRLTPGEAAFLARALPRMPGQNDANDPVTIDLNGHLAVRTKGEGQDRITEVALPQSTVTGPSVRFRTNRCYLSRALALGFAEFQVANGSTPVVCQDDKRCYTWMPLGKERSLEPTDNAVRITPPAEEVEPVSKAKERSKPRMTRPASNGPANSPGNGHATNGMGNGRAAEQSAMTAGDRQTPAASLGALITEAQALKDTLRDVYHRSGQLLAGLKRHRRQSKLLAGTVAALRQLQDIGG